MAWKPISLEELESQIVRGLREADGETREFYERFARYPVKWQLHPWGDVGGGFWIVAVYDDRVLWFNDIECGFNVSTFQHEGLIPTDQYWCNQDEIRWALAALRDGGAGKSGPPEPLGS